MVMTIRVDQTIDCKGLACPMPVVKTKKAIDALATGQVLVVEATDRGSLADLKAWSERTGHHYVGHQELDGVLHHYIRRGGENQVHEVTPFAHTITNKQLADKLAENGGSPNGTSITVLDVREPAEYAFGHIPGAISIPFGSLGSSLEKLESNKTEPIYVICRTGSRSDMACQLLADNGFSQVFNVVPGMSDWSGEMKTLV